MKRKCKNLINFYHYILKRYYLDMAVLIKYIIKLLKRKQNRSWKTMAHHMFLFILQANNDFCHL